MKVLFVCIHNSARSQMAEAFFNQLAGGKHQAQSAGIEPGKLNPFAVQAMREAGLDISKNATQSIQGLIAAGRQYDYIVTVCDEASAERCPVFPGSGRRAHFGFQDPSSFQGSDDDKLQKTREIRDQIKEKITTWLKKLEEARA